MPGKRIQIDDETWVALDLLSRDSMKSFQELADEAFRGGCRRMILVRGGSADRPRRCC